MARRYLDQLCKHFAHKIPVSRDAAGGRADFPWGTCYLRADEENLSLRCEAPDGDALERVMSVVEDHVVRFGWRESLTLAWEAVP